MKQKKEEKTPASRPMSLIILYVTLGAKKMNLLKDHLGTLLVRVTKREKDWELVAYRKNALKVVQAVLSFFKKERISKETKEGLSRFVFPFKRVLSKPMRNKLGLAVTPVGLVFKPCVQKVEESLLPVIPIEKRAFAKWDKAIDKLLAAYTEKKQYTTKKWLEMTEPVLKHSEL